MPQDRRINRRHIVDEEPNLKANHPTLPLLILITGLLLGLTPLVACSPAVQTAAPAQPTTIPTTPATSTLLPATATLPYTSTPLPSATLAPSATLLPPTLTITLPKPTNTRAPTATLIPTSPYISKTIRLPNVAPMLINFEDGALWAIFSGTIHKLDPATGKSLQSTKSGCNVCFGACDTFATARSGQVFWFLQYGGIGEQDCSASDPWKSIGFMLRRIKAGSSTGEYIDISSIMQTSPDPQMSRIAVNEDKIWLADGEVIYLIDAAKSKPDQPAIVRTILPGIAVEGLLFANNTLWAGGEVLLAINPSTQAVDGIFPLEAELLAFDGKRIWGVSKRELWLQSVDIKTKELSDPILLPQDDMPTAIGFSGKAIWVGFMTSTRVVVISTE